MRIFDTHAHYFDRRFENEVEGGADAILSAIMPEPVERIVNVGTNCQNSRRAVEQAARYAGMYAAVGIHPEDCHFLPDADAALTELREILGDAESRRRDKIVAVGEIGLDYHWQQYGDIPMDKGKQAYFFDAQMELAHELDLPVIIHDREAHGDVFDAVCAHPNVRGVFHSYSGSAEMARDLVRRGWYISFSGVVTFKNAPRVREVVEATPLERILIETDAPYLAPGPYRGQMNHSGLMRYTAEAIAEVKGIKYDEVLRATSENAKKLYKI